MPDKKWMVSVIGLLLLFAYLFTRFALESSNIDRVVRQFQGTGTAQPHAHHVVLIEQEKSHPYWQIVEQGATDAAHLYGLDLEPIGPIVTNMDEEIKLLEKAIAAKVDGIVVQGLNDSKFTPIINKAVEKGIPVLTIDTDAPTSKRLSYVGTDNVEAGKVLGRLVEEKAGPHGKIGVIIGSATAESQQQRLSGFKSIISQNPNLKIVDVRSSDISMVKAIQQASEMMTRHPEINVMVGTSSTDALGILEARKSLNRNDIRIFSFDNLQETLEALDRREIEATVAQQPYLMGYQSIRLLVDHFQGKSVPESFFTTVQVMTSSGQAEKWGPLK